MALPGSDVPRWDSRSSAWISDFARHPFGGWDWFVGRWLGGVVGSVMFPGWLVLGLIGEASSGWWVEGWDKWGPVVVAHLMTGLVLSLAFTLRQTAKRAREYVSAWETGDRRPA